MISVEDIQIYLPKYLSPDSEKSLFKELKQFPENIDDRMGGHFGSESVATMRRNMHLSQ